MRTLFLATALFLLAPTLALADTTSSTAINLSPILTDAIQLVGLIVLALAGYGFTYLKNKWKLDIDAQTRAFLDQAIQNGISYADNTLGKLTAGATVNVGNPQIAAVANYVIAHAPDALAHFGVTPEALQRKIISLLPPQTP